MRAGNVLVLTAVDNNFENVIHYHIIEIIYPLISCILTDTLEFPVTSKMSADNVCQQLYETTGQQLLKFDTLHFIVIFINYYFAS
jgi:hypothetical protein